MSINTDGILSASAQDLDTKASNSLSLKLNDVSLQPEEREKAVERAKKMKVEDECLKQSLIAKDKLTGYLLDLQSQIRYQKAKFTPSKIQKIEEIVREGLKWMKEHPRESADIFDRKLREIQNQLSDGNDGGTDDL
jgi:molecular chaperone DnaK (HSP70)